MPVVYIKYEPVLTEQLLRNWRKKKKKLAKGLKMKTEALKKCSF